MYDSKDVNNVKLSLSRKSLNHITFHEKAGKEHRAIADSFFPAFTFDVTYPDSSIDYFGRVIEGAAVAENIKIIYSSDEIHFKNFETGHNIPYIFDALAFSQCLEREVYENMD